jgi:di/tricarboxylate transporter
MMLINYKLFMVSIILAEIILCAGYLFVLKFCFTSKEIKKSNNLLVSTTVNLNFKEEKIQKLPEAIIIGEAKCGKLLFLIKIIA